MPLSLEAERVRASLKSRLFGASPEPVRLGRFEILEPLGRGGMGTVYRASDPELQREVAIKILHGDVPAERLLLEARAMARLEHPNVVGVYEVGTAAGRAFVVMELVRGRNLSSWLQEQRRAPEDILRLFASAARGLEAAHRAGIVHRDFKPANVLVTADGQARVADFGLAGAAEVEEEPRGPVEPTPLSRTRIAGTPFYMAPELLDGAQATPASDQFAFGVSLFEACAGQRPFDAPTLDALRSALQEPVVTPSSVPRRARDVLRRCLAPRPADRCASMAEVARALEPTPRDAGRLGVLAVVVSVVSAGALAFAMTRAPQASLVCSGSDKEMETVWSSERKAELTTALEATALPFASDAARRTVAAIDVYADSWRRMHRDACEAANVRREQSSAVLDRRMACLARRRAELDSLIKELETADGDALEVATEGVGKLVPIERCAELDRLERADRHPPAEAEAAVAAVRALLARGRAQRDLRKIDAAIATAEQALARAKEAAFAPLVAEALVELGRAHLANAELEKARTASLEAADIAESAGADEAAASAWIVALASVGKGAVKPEQTELYERRARALIARLGDPADLVGDLEELLGRRRRDDGKLDEALAHHRVELALREQVHGERSLEAADARANVAGVLVFLDRLEEATRENDRALAEAQAVLGADHPRLSSMLNKQGMALKLSGRYEEARATLSRALTILERAVGPDTERASSVMMNLGNTCLHLRRFDEARALHERVIAIKQRTFGPDHPAVALAINNLANVALEEKRWEDAVVLHTRALAIREKALAPTDRMIGMSLTNLGDALVGAKRPEEAIDRYRASAAILEKLQGGKHSWLGYPLTGLGVALLDTGKPAEAIAPLERALAIRDKPGLAEDIAAETRFALARALFAAGKDRPRALSLAREAREAFVAAGPMKSSFVAEVDGWLTRVGERR